MKRYWIKYGVRTHPLNTTMGNWVHRQVRVKDGSKEARIEPPLPGENVGKGYPIFMVEIDGFTFRFVSLDEIRVCIDTLEQKHLPRYRGLSRVITRKPRPNRHWLNILPGKVMKWRYREEAVKYLRKALKDFRKQGFSESIAQPENNTI